MTRRAAPADAAALVELRAAMFEAMGTPGVADPAWRQAARGWFERELAGRHTCVMVVEEDGRVVACAMGQTRDEAPSPSNPGGGSGLVANVVTHPDARRRGHARACLEALVAWFRDETDVGRLELFATGEGSGLYEEVGFHRHEWPAMRMPLTRLPGLPVPSDGSPR